MTSLILTQEEVRELTGRVQHSAQAKALNYMGIVHKVRADGAIVVLRLHLEHVLGMKATVRKAEEEPNWAAATTDPAVKPLRRL